MAGRASIVGAAATHVGKVRDHNEDAHFIDAELGVFLVCDGMGGHAAGEVASALAISAITQEWGSEALREVVEQWLERGTPDARKRLIAVVRAGVLAAHRAILAEADLDDAKSGMGTTLVGAMIVGGELLFAHAGDSRAYLVRDGISMQLTEDHTLLARLLAAGIDVDVSGEGARFRSMLTNALGIGEECKVSTFVVPLADGDRFLLCSDGISEYVPENEVGDVLTKQPSPARAAQRLIDLALERGGGDNATAVVVRVLEAGETPLPAEQRKKDDAAISACSLWGRKITPQQRLRALRIAIPRDHGVGDKLPPHTMGDRVAWIIVEGEAVQYGEALGPGAFVYPESLMVATHATAEATVVTPSERDGLAVTRSEVRALALRADDFRELCDDDGELGEALLEGLAAVVAKRKPRVPSRSTAPTIDPRGATDPQLKALPRRDMAEAQVSFEAGEDVDNDVAGRARAVTVPDEPNARRRGRARAWSPNESPVIAPVGPRASSPPISARPSQPALVSKPGGRITTQDPVSPQVGSVARAASPPAQAQVAAGAAHAAHASSSPPAHGAMPRTTTQPPLQRAGSPPGLASTADTARGTPKGVARAHTPTVPPEARPPTPLPLPPPPEAVALVDADGEPPKRPSDPEIEAYFEIEADLPPESGIDPELESELAVNIALSGDLDDEHESMSVTFDEDDVTGQIETVSDSGSHTITLVHDGDGGPTRVRKRPITVQDGTAVSGTIGPRAKRHSDGWDE